MHAKHRSAGAACALAFAMTLFGVGPTVGQPKDDRERAQIRQLQQQLQRVQQENAALVRDRDAATAKAREAEQASRELGSARAGASAARRDLAAARGEAQDLRVQLEQLRSETARLQSELKARDEALAAAAQTATSTQRRFEIESNVLATRLKQQTARVELCEARHADLMATAKEVLSLYEQDRLRLCEPVTGLWRVREETQIQGLRERLLDARLEVPAPAQTR